MLDPAEADIKDVIVAIENRDKEMRAELVDFIRGTRVRVDVPTPMSKSEGSDATTAHGGPVALIPAPSQEAVEQITTTPPRSGVDTLGLRAAYLDDAAVKTIIDHFANRQYNQYVTELDAFCDKLDRTGTPMDKQGVIRGFRRLDALGVGRFLVGRRGQPTRFEWHEKSLTVRKIATDEASA
jgi:hypothetical protein